jgi:hypothetical protein
MLAAWEAQRTHSVCAASRPAVLSARGLGYTSIVLKDVFMWVDAA